MSKVEGSIILRREFPYPGAAGTMSGMWATVVYERGITVKGGRTGKKVHGALRGNSVTFCGKWLKFEVSNFEVAEAEVEALCERCFPKVTGKR